MIVKGNPFLSPAPTIRLQLEALTRQGMEGMGDLEYSCRIYCIGCSSSMTLRPSGSWQRFAVLNEASESGQVIGSTS